MAVVNLGVSLEPVERENPVFPQRDPFSPDFALMAATAPHHLDSRGLGREEAPDLLRLDRVSLACRAMNFIAHRSEPPARQLDGDGFVVADLDPPHIANRGFWAMP